MTTILGIESTAHTFGIGIVSNGKILSNIRDMYTTESGGIIPTESAEHHKKISHHLYQQSLREANLDEKDIDAIAFSQGPGLAPCLLVGMKFAKELSKRLKKPLIPVNHCVAHLEIGKITGAKDPVLLYCSGANTQVIAYSSGKYRIFGETLDIGVGNFIDTIARFFGLGFPGGPKIQELASHGKEYIELPYKVKGMDVAFSGIQTKLKQLIEKLHLQNDYNLAGSESAFGQDSSLKKIDNHKNSKYIDYKNLQLANYIDNSKKFRVSENERDKLRKENSEVNYTKEDLAYSMQETVFAMLVETAERALAHTGKKELLLGGGVACNKRLQEMCKIMCEERGAKLFVPPRDLLVDNGAMIAFQGELQIEEAIHPERLDEIDIKPRQRTDEIEIKYK